MKILKRYYFTQPNYPTSFNIIKKLKEKNWKQAYFKWQADFGDDNLNYNKDVSECLELKHLLAHLVNEYLPEIMPLTYVIHEENWVVKLQQLSQNKRIQGPWILKPALLNNGQAIRIFKSIQEVEAYYYSPQRLLGEYVLQAYIENPDLLRDARKYSIRLFLVLSKTKGAFLYPYGYLNVAKHPYQPFNYGDLRSHLTNEHLLHEETNVIQIPSERFDWFKEIYPQLKKMVDLLIKQLRRSFPDAFTHQNTEQLALFGLDFMLDANKRPWLLEANHGPCFPIDANHPLSLHLYSDFFDALVSYFVCEEKSNPAPFDKL